MLCHLRLGCSRHRVAGHGRLGCLLSTHRLYIPYQCTLPASMSLKISQASSDRLLPQAMILLCGYSEAIQVVCASPVRLHQVRQWQAPGCCAPVKSARASGSLSCRNDSVMSLLHQRKHHNPICTYAPLLCTVAEHDQGVLPGSCACVLLPSACPPFCTPSCIAAAAADPFSMLAPSAGFRGSLCCPSSSIPAHLPTAENNISPRLNSS